MGHQSYVLLCTETTLSNPPVVQPKSSCDVHLLRSPWLNLDMSGKIEVKSPSVRRLSKLYLPLTHAIPLEIRHAGKQAILTQSR